MRNIIIIALSIGATIGATKSVM